MELEKFYYDNKIVRKFAWATIIWGIVGMLVGLFAALQLAAPDWYNNWLGLSWLSFGRLRPLHTNAVIFAFVGNGIFTGVYYSMQRLLKTRMYSDALSNINFWGWQFIILCAAITLPMGISTAKEYAELEWWVDILIALVWVVFGLNMVMTLVVRRVQHMYVAIWFYLATFVTIAMLHIVNSMEYPVSFMKSYSMYAGVQDALVQWWYGHNAVAFFLTTPYLGLMYYFIPKAANRPVFSYRLSIIHFWTLIFMYIWAGPHHLLYSTLPDWAQTLGVVFSVMLIFPSWGGMLNGLLTLRGAWDRVRDQVELKFMVVAVTCYGMSTFEGPMLSLKSFNGLTHFTDWIIAHVHVGTLGWNGMLTFGMLYWLFKKLYKTELYSRRLANIHFWLGTLGIVVYALPLYWAGLVQGLMWQDFNADGSLANPEFLDTVTQITPMYDLRAWGGLIYFIGVCVMAWNLYKTARIGEYLGDEADEAAPLPKVKAGKEYWHNALERKPVKFLIFSLIAVAIGGLVEIVPMAIVDSNIERYDVVKPNTALEMEGRDIYTREGCYYCHSQLVRPLRFDTERYGEYSKSGEFVYDHPFQWGSKRTGPDLAREGTQKIRKPDSWHYEHLLAPKLKSPGSIMPNFPWLTDELNTGLTKKKIGVMRKIGVPYEAGYEEKAHAEMNKQATAIATNIINDLKGDLKGKSRQDEINKLSKQEAIALIAYLQRLGTDIEKMK